jgi:hypothetical protein
VIHLSFLGIHFMYHLLFELNKLFMKNINNGLIAPDPRRRIKLSRRLSPNFIVGSKHIENKIPSKLKFKLVGKREGV